MAKVEKSKAVEATLKGFSLLTEDEADEVATKARTREAKYPFKQLEIGQGFFAPAEENENGETNEKSLRNTLYSSASRQGVRVKVSIGERKDTIGCFVVRIKEKEEAKSKKAA